MVRSRVLQSNSAFRAYLGRKTAIDKSNASRVSDYSPAELTRTRDRVGDVDLISVYVCLVSTNFIVCAVSDLNFCIVRHRWYAAGE